MTDLASDSARWPSNGRKQRAYVIRKGGHYVQIIYEFSGETYSQLLDFFTDHDVEVIGYKSVRQTVAEMKEAA